MRSSIHSLLFGVEIVNKKNVVVEVDVDVDDASYR